MDTYRLAKGILILPLLRLLPSSTHNRCGYDKIIFARPKFHDLLLRQIPPEKITLGKRILRTEEKDDKVLIHCSDNSTYAGDILIGADGAYSSVRQSLYKRLGQQGILPKSDQENLELGFNCMVGVTDSLDPERFKQLKDDYAHFTAILGRDRLSVSFLRMATVA
jgi:2-polyprenyl-6-methoxyphenol hydroxylase-like FAD-dependent oxidoreductase